MTPAELAEAFRQAPGWKEAIADFQALAVAEMRATVTVAEIAATLGLTNKRIYQILDEAQVVLADPRRTLRAGAIAGLVSPGWCRPSSPAMPC